MRLSELAAGFGSSGPDPGITGLSEDSRRITPGMLFVAVSGSADDGHRFIADAVSRGAVAIALERGEAPPGIPYVRVPSSRAALAVLAPRFYGHPARELQLIGFTGTFGKTSTSGILRDLLAAAGFKTGLLGSLGARYDGFHDPGRGLTTPSPVDMHRALRGLRDAGAETVIMEVTSHALLLGRVDGLTFPAGLLAAIVPGEHMDFHRSYEDYIAAKRLFLDYLAPDALLAYDADNHPARALAHDARVARRAGFSLHGRLAELRLSNIALDHAGARFTIDGRRMRSPLLGRGHLKNVALALAYGFAAGVTHGQARRVLQGLTPLRRRMERFEVAGRTVLDDTAGHPDSLEATFEVAGMLARAGRRTGLSSVVVYALRGSRGTDVNRRNAIALAGLAVQHGVARLILTASADVAGPHDRTTPEEIDTVRAAFAESKQEIEWHDTLGEAARSALDHTGEGDLIVLVGAQGMNEGRRLLLNSAGTSPRT